MDVLEFAEQQGKQAAAFSLDGVELMNKRAQTLLTMLIAGAGAAGAYALGQLSASGSLWVLCALGAVSLWWFVLAAWVAWRVLPSHEVIAPAHSAQDILAQAVAYDDYIKQARSEGETPADCLTLLRQMEIRLQDKAIESYRALSVRTAVSLDRVYRAAACTPIWAALGLAVAGWLLQKP